MIYIKKPSRKDIDTIMYDEEIYNRITDDITYGNKDVVIPYDKWFFLGAYIDNKIVSLFYVHDDNHMHFAVLKDYRKYSSQVLKEFLKVYPFSIYCVIPSLYKSVINFAKKHGFKQKEILKNKYLKNKKYYDNVKMEYEV